MDSRLYRYYNRGVCWLIAGAVATYALVEVVGGYLPQSGEMATFACLLGPALIAARRASGRQADPWRRAAMTFVLAALVLLPAPAALLIAASASIAGRGHGVAGYHRDGLGGFVSLLVAVTVGEYVARLIQWPAELSSPATLLPLGLLFAVIHAFSWIIGMALDEEAPLPLLRPPVQAWRSAGLEGLNVPLAWMLSLLLVQDAWLPAIGFSALLLLAVEALQRLGLAAQQFAQMNESLSARTTELAALHAVGRDILASMNPERVYGLLDRECRKIVDVQAWSVALADREQCRLRRVFCRNGSKIKIGETLVQGGLAARVLNEKRPLRVGDVRELPAEGSLRSNLLDPRTRSVMSVPLIVEQRVIGVLTVESLRPHSYDEHQLSVLSTMGQQAAVAIENARHYQMATVDSLTGFFVKDFFFPRLNEEDRRVRRYGGKFALLMVDLDGFKEINDTHGHLAGDRFLSEITVTIRQQLRGADLACRYGGDEFCLLLPQTDLLGARAIGERIRSAVARRIVIVDGVALRTTVSIGVAAYPEHDRGDLKSLMANADEALYRAKRAGRDRVVPFAA